MNFGSTRFLPAIVGMLMLSAFGCRSSTMSESAAPPAMPLETAAPVTATPTPTPTVPGDPYQKGLDKAVSATRLAEAAQTPDDWSLVISQWQRAIGFLKAVPKSSPDAKAAQKLLPQYQRSLAQAQQRARQQPTTVTATQTASSAGVPLIAIESETASEPQSADSEAVNNLNTLNQQQIEFFTKQKKFAANLQELGSSVAASTAAYTYRTVAPQPTQQAMSTAIAKQGKAPSYTSAVVVLKTAPQAIICATSQPSKTPPAMPQVVGQALQCPAGATRL